MKLFIDDQEVSIHSIGNDRHGYTSVTISDDGIPVSRHLVPSVILKSGGSSFTGGHKYSVKL